MYHQLYIFIIIIFNTRFSTDELFFTTRKDFCRLLFDLFQKYLTSNRLSFVKYTLFIFTTIRILIQLPAQTRENIIREN